METVLRCSTNELLNGNISQCITREDICHKKFLTENVDKGYSYPVLQQPKYLNENSKHQYNIVSQLDWLSDNSSFVSVTEDLGVRLFITPPNLLQKEDQDLIPFTRSFQDNPISAFSLHPSASIYSGFCGSLVSSNNVPLKLLNLISDENGKAQLIKTFNIQDPQTESFSKIYSMKFSSELQFIIGKHKLIQLFDINRNNSFSTIKMDNEITSCLTLSNSEQLSPGSFYSGSFHNKVNVHDPNGTVTNSVTLDKGNGISQIIESINGRYIFCISRNATSIQMLDLRMDLLPIGELESFVSKNQRITGDIFPNSKGLIIGTDDGHLNWYKDAELGLSRMEPNQILLNKNTSIPSVKINKKAPELILLSEGNRNYEKSKIDIRELQSLHMN